MFMYLGICFKERHVGLTVSRPVCDVQSTPPMIPKTKPTIITGWRRRRNHVNMGYLWLADEVARDAGLVDKSTSLMD